MQIDLLGQARVLGLQRRWHCADVAIQVTGQSAHCFDVVARRRRLTLAGVGQEQIKVAAGGRRIGRALAADIDQQALAGRIVAQRDRDGTLVYSTDLLDDPATRAGLTGLQRGGG